MKTIAIDFDDTIAISDFPEILDEVPGAIPALKAMSAAGHVLILWTCRQGQPLEKAKAWLRAHGVLDLFSSINTHSPRHLSAHGDDVRKIHADIYIDDKAIGCPRTVRGEVDWPRIMEMLTA